MFGNKKLLFAVVFAVFCGVNGRSMNASLTGRNDGCIINVNGGLGEPQPLLIIPGTTEFLLPQGSDGLVHMATGEVVELFCTVAFTAPIQQQIIMATCILGSIFEAEGNAYEFNQFVCTALPLHTVRRTGGSCYGGGIMVEAGFMVNERFNHLYDICHDEIVETNHYVHHFLSPANRGFQTSFPRPSFITGGFFGGKNVDQIYTQNNQVAVFTEILGSAELATQFVQIGTDIFLARGHLAARADKIFGNHQRATFYFLNTAPQWQAFNGGNWERIESGVRQFVADRNIECDVYTGTYGVTTLPDINGNEVELFLHFDANGNGQIPVPQIYYKVVVDRATNNGIVFVGVNNLHLSMEQIMADYIFCTDIGTPSWVNINQDNLMLGYSYTCEVNEFLSVVRHLPFVNVNGLLI